MALTYIEKVFILHFQDNWQVSFPFQKGFEILEVLKDGTIKSNIVYFCK